MGRILGYLIPILIELCCSLLLSGAEWYVSPSGTATGDGSSTNPWNLVTALTKSAVVRPGDTLKLQSGNYVPVVFNNSRLQSTIAGNASAYVTIQGLGRVVIDLKNFAGFEIQGGFTRWLDLEITNTINRPRTTLIDGSWVGEVDRGGVNIYGPEVELVDLVIHDLNSGPFSGWQTIGGRFYGLIVYNVGWQAPSRGHGHLIYLQNAGVKPKICELCIGWGAYDDGFNAYGSNESFIKNIQFIDDFAIHNGRRNLHYGGETPVEGGLIKGCVFGPPAFLPADTLAVTGGAQYVGPSPSLAIEDIYLVGAVRSSGQSVKQMTFRRNTIIGGREDQPGAGARFVDWIKSPGDVILWDQNTYYGAGKFLSNFIIKPFFQPPPGPSWQADGYDPTSKVIAGNPPDTQILKPHRYKPGKGHLAILNWSRAASVNVDLSSVVQAGKPFEIRSIYDPFGSPVASGTYSGPVSIPIGTVTPPKPIGATAPVATVDTRFQFFVVTSVGGVTPPPTAPVITSPADGTVFAIGQTYTANGSGTNLKWHVDFAGAANPPDTTGPEVTFTIPVGTTKVTLTLTGDGGSDTNTYPVGTTPPVTAVAFVVVSPSSASINVGTTLQLSAVAKDSAGNTLSGKAFTWASSAPAIATVSSSGLVSGLSSGNVVISATCEGKTGSCAVTVQSTTQGKKKELRVYRDVDDNKVYTSEDGGLTFKLLEVR